MNNLGLTDAQLDKFIRAADGVSENAKIMKGCLITKDMDGRRTCTQNVLEKLLKIDKDWASEDDDSQSFVPPIIQAHPTRIRKNTEKTAVSDEQPPANVTRQQRLNERNKVQVVVGQKRESVGEYPHFDRNNFLEKFGHVADVINEELNNGTGYITRAILSDTSANEEIKDAIKEQANNTSLEPILLFDFDRATDERLKMVDEVLHGVFGNTPYDDLNNENKNTYVKIIKETVPETFGASQPMKFGNARRRSSRCPRCRICKTRQGIRCVRSCSPKRKRKNKKHY